MDHEVPGAETQRAIRVATDRCRRLATDIARLQAELTEATRELVELEGSLGGLSVAAHLAAECQLTGAEARRTVGLARQLRALPAMARAYAEGRLSEGTTVTLASVATPDNEAVLLETAANANATQLQRLVTSYRQATEADDVDRGRPVDERLSFGVRKDGMWHISGRALPERGARIEAAFRAIGEGDEQLLSEAEVHRLEREPFEDRTVSVDGVGPIGVADDEDGRGRTPGRDPGWDQRCDRPRQSDVRPPGAIERLVRMAETILDETTTTPGLVPDRYLTIVHVDEREIEPGRVHAPIHIQGGAPIDQPSLSELLCTSKIAYAVERHGQPVTATIPQRDPSAAMRIALLARDRGCRFCGSASYLHPHHMRHVEHGGRTTLSNLVLLCGTCHRRLHRQGWSVHGDPNGPPDALEFRRADGTRIPTERLRRHPPPDPGTTGDERDPGSDGPSGARAGGDGGGGGGHGDPAVEHRRPHNDQRLDHYAKDVLVGYWLDHRGPKRRAG